MDEQIAALLYGLGRAEAALALSDEAAAHLIQAFDYYAQAGDVQRCTAVASVDVYMFDGMLRMAPVVERALQLVPPESAAAGWLLCVRGNQLGIIQGDYEGGKALLLRAVTIAQSANERRLELRALDILTLTARMGGQRLDDFEEANARALALLPSIDSPRDEAYVHSRAVNRFQWRGEVREAAAQASAAWAAAERLRDRGTMCFAGTRGQLLAQYVGNWGDARSLSERTLAADPSDGEALVFTLLLECQLGNFEQAQSYWQRLLARTERVAAVWQGFLAYPPTAEAARIRGNRDWLDVILESGRHSLATMNVPRLQSSLIRLALGLVASGEKDAVQAAEQYAHLDHFIGSGFDTMYYRYLGIIAHAAGLEDKAVAHFEDALAFTRKAGYRPELAWACCDYADLLRQRDGPGDGERAAALLEEGLVIARDLGMRPLMERILSRRQFLKA